MSRFLTCWCRSGDAVPTMLVSVADARLARDGRTPPRRLLRRDVACWHWPSAWAPGAEESLPLERDGWIGSGVLRLDERRSLADRLRDRGAAGGSNDAELAWQSFASWGEAAARAWIGDYAVAAVAPARDRLVAARGVTGVRACFHTRIRDVECVSDDLALLVDLAGGRRAPPERAIAEYLRYGQLVTPTLTFHAGVTRLPAAHTLLVGRDGALRLERHWEFPDPAVRHGRPEDEVVAEFRELLDAAVADRLRGRSAILLLSGGLDSPALAVAARRSSPAVDVRAFTMDWARLIEDDEAGFARQAAQAVGMAHEIHACAPDEGMDPVAFETPEPVPDPEPFLWRLKAARFASRAPVVLLGEDPDTLLASPTLVDQLRADGLGATAAAWRAYRRATGLRPWLGLRRSIPAIEQWRERRFARAPRWLRPEVAALAGERTPAAAPRRGHERALRALHDPIWEASNWLDDPAMTGADVTVLLPFMDPRVIRFCFSLPAVPWLQRKYLLRRTLEGQMPQAIIDRAKASMRGYYEARVRVWHERGAPAPLPVPVGTWVDDAPWRRSLAATGDADATFAAWRVLELSRWLAQPVSR